jgi:Proprotein convertase P-domain
MRKPATVRRSARRRFPLGLRHTVRLALVAFLTMTMSLVGTASATAAAAGTRASTTPPMAASALAADNTALTNLSSCLTNRKVGELVLLIDTSASLKGAGGADPSGVRVDAAQALLARLTDSLLNSAVTIDVAIAGFAENVRELNDFTPLTADTLPVLNSTVEQFRTLDDGPETDYWTALTWLNQKLQTRAATRSPGGPVCSFAFWFTDGELDIVPRNVSSPGNEPYQSETKPIPGFEQARISGDNQSAIEKAIESDMCRPGGVADQMRSAEITLISVGLGKKTFDLVRRYTENSVNNCGQLPGTGTFIPAASVADLFAAMGAFPDFPEVIVTDLCQQAPAPCASHTFALDNTIGKVRLSAAVSDEAGTALIPSKDLRVELTAPNGEKVSLTADNPAPVAITQTTVAHSWYATGGLTATMTRPAGADWAGTWNLTFIDVTNSHPGAVSKFVLVLSSDFQVVPTVAGAPWRVGQPSGEIRLVPKTLDGADVVVTELPPSANVKAELVLPDGSLVPLEATLGQPITRPIPEGSPPGAATVRVELNITLAGKALQPVKRETTVDIQPPFGVPFLSPADQVVDFGVVQGVDARSATLAVRGPDTGNGCVSVAPGQMAGVPTAGMTIGLSGAGAAAGCYQVPQGQTVNVPLTLTPSEQGRGLLTGKLAVTLWSEENPGQRTTASADYRLAMERLPNLGVKIWVLVIAGLIFVAITLGLMALARRLSARFPEPERALRSLSLEVKIGSGGLTKGDGQPLALPREGWTAVQPPGAGRRTLMIAGVLLKAKAGWRLTEPGYAVLDDSVAADSVGYCSAEPHHDAEGRPRLPLAVQGTWTLLVPRRIAASPLDEVSGRLLVVVAADAEDRDRQRLLDSAARDAPSAMSELRKLVRESSRNGDGNLPPRPPAHQQGPSTSDPDGWDVPATSTAGGWTAGQRPVDDWGTPSSAPQSSPPQGTGWNAPPGGGWDAPPPGVAGRPGSAPYSPPPGWGSSSSGRPGASGDDDWR